MSQGGDLERQVRDYWDLDAATYDHSPGHDPQTPVELAVWAATLRRLLPPPPARVLDVGAGTGFLTLLLAREGYRVTALDLAPGMLAQLRAKAQRRSLSIEIVEGNAAEPPRDGYDAVVERHLVWTLPEPKSALEAWHRAGPTGTLVLLESTWGSDAGPEEQLRARARALRVRSCRSGRARARSCWSGSLTQRAGAPLELSGFATWSGRLGQHCRRCSTGSWE